MPASNKKKPPMNKLYVLLVTLLVLCLPLKSEAEIIHSAAEDGLSCEAAVQAVQGANNFSHTEGASWYKFTMPKDGKLHISSENSGNVVVYTNTCQNMHYQTQGESFAALPGLNSGEQVYIEWNNVFDGGSGWSLAVEDNAEGDICSLASPAVAGENILPATSHNFWYTFTMPKDGKLSVKSVFGGGQFVNIYTNNCEQLHYKNGGTNAASVGGLPAGEQVFIKWGSPEGAEFSWNLFVEENLEGDVCNLAVTATEGSNVVPAGYGHYWYRFIMPKEGKLLVNSTDGGYFTVNKNSCESQIFLKNSFNAGSVTGLKEGEEVFIVWTDPAGFDISWNLAVEDHAEGDLCSLAATAVEGENRIPAGYREFWYSFTMPKEGKISVSSGVNEALSIYTGGCENLLYKESGARSVSVAGLTAGEKIFINWDVRNGGNFSWNLAVGENQEGDLCSLPFSATEGENAFPFGSGDYWYHFTMPREGKLSISTEEYTNISVYGNTCGNLQYLKNANSGLSVSGLAAGDEVYINFTTYSSGSWSLAVSENGAGDLCGLAVTAVQGTNTVPTNYGEYWFRYTMPRDGKINITSASNERLNVFSGSCENLLYKDYGYGVVSVAGLVAGDEVYVSWINQYGGNFDWELSLEENAEGDICRTAVTAVEGANSVPAGLGDYWTRFTMPKGGKLRITSEMGRNFSIYKNSCESPEFLKDGYNSGSVAGLGAGEEVFVQWTENRTEGFSWSLAVEDHTEGDICSLAVTAVEGENSVPAGFGEFWYRFTMPKAGKINITSDDYGSVILYKSNSCAELYNATYGHQKVSKAGMEEGEEVLIYWESFYSETGFSWNLAVEGNAEGDICTLAKPAAEGVNVAPSNTGDYWYRFTMPKEGKLLITSEKYFNIYVSANNCDNPETKGSGYRNLSVAGLMEGEEVLIRWLPNEGVSFSWNLAVEDNQEGDLCRMAVTAVEGANTVPAGHGKYWFRFIMPNEGKLSVNTDHYEYTSFYKSTCEALNYIKNGIQNASLTGLAAGEVVYISWDNRYGGDFSWNLVVEDYSEGDLCSMAIPVAEGDHFLPAANGDYWYRFVMPKDGKLNITTQNWNKVTVYSNNCEQLHYKKEGHGDISVAGLLSGEVIYILQTKDSGGDFSWNIKVEENEAGDICSLAIAAAEGENLIPDNGMDYWSAFNMPVDGRLIITPDAYRYFQVFKNSCDNYKNSGSEKTIISNLAVGDQVLIKWSVQDSQTSGYNLAVEELLPGEGCNMAAEAVSGINTVPAVVNGEYWYTYTIPQDGRLILTSETSNYVSVYGNSCELSYSKGGASGNFAADNFYAGETVLIRWDNNSGESFNWNLSTEGYAEGEICALAVQATEGINTVPLADQEDFHFNFTMPRDGKLIITSESTASVNISTGTCTYGTSIGSGMTRIVAAGLEAGENVKILWRNIRNTPFDWNLAIEEHEEGDLCSSAFVAVEGENTAPASQDEKWFRYSMPKDGKIKISSTGDNKASLYRGSCEYDRLSADYNSRVNPEMGSLKKGQIVFIKWTNSTAEAFIWNLSVEDDLPGENCNLAVNAVEGENQVPESVKGSFWYKFVMPAEGHLNISSEVSNTFWVWKGNDCAYQFVNFGVGSIMTGYIPEGETVYVNWEGINGNFPGSGKAQGIARNCS